MDIENKNTELLDDNYAGHITFARGQRKSKSISDMESVSRRHYRPSLITPRQVSNYLNNPYANVSNLQDLSQKMVLVNGMLKEFINYKALILTQDHYIYPADARKYKTKESLWKDEQKVAEFLEKFGIKTLNRWITKRLLQNGEVYIYKRETPDGFLIQELPSKICKTVALDEYGVLRFAIDISKISDEDIGFFPDEIAKAKEKKSNSKNKKNQLKGFVGEYYYVGDNGVAFLMNQWETKGLPYYTHLFASLMNLSDAEDLEKTSNNLDNYKLLHQLIPTDKEGKNLMKSDLVSMYHYAAKETLPEGIGIVTTPMEINPITLGDNKLKNQDYLNKLKEKIYDNAGISNDLFNGNAKTNESTILSSIIDTLVPIEIQGYLEKYYNYELAKAFKKGNWKIQFVPTSYYNRQKEIKTERENLAVYGSKKKYLAVQGFTPLQVLNILYAEDLMGIEEFMKPMATAHTLSSKGRPSTADGTEPTSVNTE